MAHHVRFSIHVYSCEQILLANKQNMKKKKTIIRDDFAYRIAEPPYVGQIIIIQRPN